jgi:hypothetical protein
MLKHLFSKMYMPAVFHTQNADAFSVYLQFAVQLNRYPISLDTPNNELFIYDTDYKYMTSDARKRYKALLPELLPLMKNHMVLSLVFPNRSKSLTNMHLVGIGYASDRGFPHYQTCYLRDEIIPEIKNEAHIDLSQLNYDFDIEPMSRPDIDMLILNRIKLIEVLEDEQEKY